MIPTRFISLCSLGLAGPLSAQPSPTGGFTLVSSNTVSPTNPTTVVELWAWFNFVPTQAEIFGVARTNIEASDGDWSSASYTLQQGPHLGPMISGSFILDIHTGQLHFPPAGIFAKPDNPILIMTAEWTTIDFTPRLVDLTTFGTDKFWIYQNQQGSSTLQLPPSSIFEGSGVIQVVPAPSAGLIMACGVLARRRRQWECV